MRAIMEWITDAPNWVKLVPGLVLLAISFIIYLNGYIWPWSWIGGVLGLTIGIATVKKKSDYNF